MQTSVISIGNYDVSLYVGLHPLFVGDKAGTWVPLSKKIGNYDVPVNSYVFLLYVYVRKG
jgi:hypothetical protein